MLVHHYGRLVLGSVMIWGLVSVRPAALAQTPDPSGVLGPSARPVALSEKDLVAAGVVIPGRPVTVDTEANTADAELMEAARPLPTGPYDVSGVIGVPPKAARPTAADLAAAGVRVR